MIILIKSLLIGLKIRLNGKSIPSLQVSGYVPQGISLGPIRTIYSNEQDEEELIRDGTSRGHGDQEGGR